MGRLLLELTRSRVVLVGPGPGFTMTNLPGLMPLPTSMRRQCSHASSGEDKQLSQSVDGSRPEAGVQTDMDFIQVGRSLCPTASSDRSLT